MRALRPRIVRLAQADRPLQVRQVQTAVGPAVRLQTAFRLLKLPSLLIVAVQRGLLLNGVDGLNGLLVEGGEGAGRVLERVPEVGGAAGTAVPVQLGDGGSGACENK